MRKLQKKQQEVKALLMKEHEEAEKEAAEHAPVVQELQVVVRELIDELISGNAKLQRDLVEVETQLWETKALLMMEHEEAAKEAAEQVPVVQEAPVVYHELTNKILLK